MSFVGRKSVAYLRGELKISPGPRQQTTGKLWTEQQIEEKRRLDRLAIEAIKERANNEYRNPSSE